MLMIGGARQRYCAGVSRRSFLRIGGLAMGGLALPEILRAEGRAASASSHKAIIMVYLAGGPSHQDMVDLKMEAPSSIRGEFRPIRTNVAGIQICEHMPRLAAMIDKVAIIRSLYGCVNQHESDQCLSGWPSVNGVLQGGQPSLGSVLSHLHGPVDRAVPPFVYLTPKVHPGHANPGQPGFLGGAHAPFRPESDGRASLALQGISLQRLRDRRAMVRSLDRFRRQVDGHDARQRLDSFSQRAFDILSSSKLADALDVEREDVRVRDKYGRGSPHIRPEEAAPLWMDQFLIARRLVEAGVRCVTVAFGNWDTHEANFPSLARQLPLLDQGLAALIEDLHARGLDKDVSVVAWGEFGRTPRLNPQAGRDHWTAASCALLAGGGLRTGQVIGSTNRLGQAPHDRPVHYQEVFATLYHKLGINVQATMIADPLGRPRHLLDRRQPIHELV